MAIVYAAVCFSQLCLIYEKVSHPTGCSGSHCIACQLPWATLYCNPSSPLADTHCFVHVLLVLIFCVFQARCSFLYISISVVWPFRTSAYVLLTVVVNISVNLLAGCVTVQSSADLCHNNNIYMVCILAGVGETMLNCTCAGAFTIPLRKSQTMSHSMILQTVTD